MNKTTQQLIKKMINEPPLTVAGDSSGIYPSQYELNQKKERKNYPVFVEFSKYDECIELDSTIQTSYLLEKLEHNKKCEKIEQEINHDITNILGLYSLETNYSEGIDNTYNYESILDQDILYVVFIYDDEIYMGISLHNGVDIRAGYTNCYIFQTDWLDDFLMSLFESLITCSCALNHYALSSNQTLHKTEKNGKNIIYETAYIDKDNILRCKRCHEPLLKYPYEYQRC